jgi:hypothetical protein
VARLLEVTVDPLRPVGRLRRKARPLILATALAIASLAATSATATAASAAPADPPAAPNLCPDATTATFGPNVCVFTPSMTQAQIQADLNAVATAQVPVASQFTSGRYAIFFEPGTYGSAASPLVFQVGYYTQVAGLGFSPKDTVINGAIDVFNNLCTAGTSNCNADDNFWRSLSNVTLNVKLPSTPPAYAPPALDPFGPGCANSAEFWAASQAAPLRRDIINGSIVFQDYCANNNFASGGFIADSQVSGDLNFFGNQQYMVRNDAIGGSNGCPGGLWNNVYSGVTGAPAPVFTGQCNQNTVLATSPVTEEAPFLYDAGNGNYQVFVPAVRHNTSGPSWADGSEAGTSTPLSQFYIATPASSPDAITAAAAQGKNVLFTPGVYNLSSQITIPHPDTVLLGLGFATFVPTSGNTAIQVNSAVGVHVSGLMFDAGPVNSPVLLQVGTNGSSSADKGQAAATDPDTIQDVFFRVGGAETVPTSATVSLEDNASYSIVDDVWIWRADHGNAVGWTLNTGDTGLVVNGDNVTAYGLAVEHYQKSEVVWNGQGGTDIFFQNELPYDVPSQGVWNQSATFLGYPAFEVGSNVKTFSGYGLGSYVVFINTPATLHVTAAFEAPNTPGVQFHNVCGVWIAGSGGFDSVVNGVGGPVTSVDPGTVKPVDVTSYP